MPDDLTDDARVIAGATAGPWEDAERYGAVLTRAFPITLGEPSEAYGGVPICESAKKNDRAFIARARTRYPELVAEVRELRLILEKIVEHATAEKPPETAPPRNRLQNIVCWAEKGLARAREAP